MGFRSRAASGGARSTREADMQYKVWIHVERVDEENDEYLDIGIPELAGEFDTEDEAFNLSTWLQCQAENIPLEED